MWLITSLVAAILVTAAWRFAPRGYRLDMLAAMLWALTAMVLVDHIMNYSGGPFIHMETTGLITNGVFLGIAMLVPVFVIWGAYLMFSERKVRNTTG